MAGQGASTQPRRATVGAFPHRAGGHCASSALRDLMDLHGLSYTEGRPSEGMAFGLSGALSFMSAEVPELGFPVYIIGRATEFERSFCEAMSLPVEVRETADYDEAWTWVEGELDGGRAALLWANMRELDYQSVRLDNSTHDVIVTGYDLDEGVVVLADHDFPELQRCSLDSFALARNSDGFPGPNRNRMFLIDFERGLPPAREAARAALRRAVANMRGSAPAGAPYVQGVEGIERFRDSYLAWPESFGDELGRTLKLLHILIARAGTGGALFRSLQAAFLTELAPLLGDELLGRAASAYAELAAAWCELAEVARLRPAEAAHARGIELVSRVAELERSGVELIEGWLESERAA